MEVEYEKENYSLNSNLSVDRLQSLSKYVQCHLLKNDPTNKNLLLFALFILNLIAIRLVCKHVSKYF